MTRHSNIIGGSTADRLLHCPGSFQLINTLPEQTDVPSAYADYGSAMHAVMDHLMAMFGDGFPAIDTVLDTAEDLIGDVFYDRVLTETHIEDSIHPAIVTLYELMDLYGGSDTYRAVANELRVRFPGVPGAFGTTDLLVANTKHIILVDWKFGQGVPVRAVYNEPEGARVNPQLLFYFAGAMNTLPKLFTKKRFVVAIIQPRTEDRLTHTTISRKEIEYFIDDVDNAIVTALKKSPPLVVGDHCRWCPARPVCPQHTEPLFELTELGIAAPALKASVSDDGTYGEFLAKAKYLADMAADYKKQVDEALHTYLTSGGTVPGWRLKLKTKLRQWVDEDTVVPWMRDHGFDEEEIWQTKLQTFAVADRAAKKHGVKIPDEFRVAPESTETTLATTDDPAPQLDFAAAAEEFREALKQLQHG
jgi:hypothetical protein